MCDELLCAHRKDLELVRICLPRAKEYDSNGCASSTPCFKLPEDIRQEGTFLQFLLSKVVKGEYNGQKNACERVNRCSRWIRYR